MRAISRQAVLTMVSGQSNIHLRDKRVSTSRLVLMLSDEVVMVRLLTQGTCTQGLLSTGKAADNKGGRLSMRKMRQCILGTDWRPYLRQRAPSSLPSLCSPCPFSGQSCIDAPAYASKFLEQWQIEYSEELTLVVQPSLTYLPAKQILKAEGSLGGGQKSAAGQASGSMARQPRFSFQIAAGRI